MNNKKSVPLIKSVDLIKKKERYCSNKNEFDSLRAACINISQSLYKTQLFAAKNYYETKIAVDKYFKLAARFQREFLREERKEPFISANPKHIIEVEYLLVEITDTIEIKRSFIAGINGLFGSDDIKDLSKIVSEDSFQKQYLTSGYGYYLFQIGVNKDNYTFNQINYKELF